MRRMTTVGMLGSALLVVLGSAFVVGGCAKEPTEELTAAKRAAEAAQAAGAVKYAPDDFAKVQGQLTAAEKEIGEQRGKFAPFRGYGKAKELLAKAKADAGQLQKNVEVKKEEAKKAAEAAEQEAKQAVAGAAAMLAKAPGGKGTKADISALREDLKGLEASLQEVREGLEKADYLEAKAKATEIKDKAGKIASDVEQAIAKVAASKKGKR